MFAHDLHVALAAVSLAAFVVVAVEASWRAVANRPAGRFASITSAVAVVVVGMTAAGGLAMLVRGEGPAEALHYVYATLAFVVVPVGDSITQTSGARRRAVGRVLAAIVALGVVARLFATG